ncbi:hypothetical protein ES705_05352 [subsurface metagenome]
MEVMEIFPILPFLICVIKLLERESNININNAFLPEAN